MNYTDTRSTNIGAFDYKGISVHLKSNATDGLSDGGTYHGVMHITQWGDASGGNSHQIGLTDNGNIWYRDWNGTAWSAWVKFAKTSDVPTNNNQLTNGSEFITLSQAPVKSVNGRTGAVTLTSTDVGLGNVNNTSDANKPVSTAQQTALNLKAPLASPALTGTPTSTTPAMADNSTKIATTAFIKAQGYITSASAGTVVTTSITQPTGSKTGDVWIATF